MRCQMPDFILFMHDDATSTVVDSDWQTYLDGLQAAGVLRGGSAIGDGTCYRRSGSPGARTTTVVGYIKLEEDTFEAAARHLAGNPVYEAGGTVEVRVLPETN